MGQYLQQVEGDTAAALAQAEQKLAALTRSKAWEAAKTTADLTGIVDPTPASDLVSMGMSIAERDWVGALLSGVSFVPYLGDALAKPIKLARAAKVVSKIEAAAAALAKLVDVYKSNAMKFAQRRMAAAAERARRAKEAAAKYTKDLNCIDCNRFGSKLPKTKGKWAGERGNSRWTSEDGKVSIEYREGYPDFKTSQPVSLHKDGGGTVDIFQTGNNVKDFEAARNEMRKKTGDMNWPGIKEKAPEGYTWHHKEDGVTMELVESRVHDATSGGASHTGGSSIVKSPQF